MAILLNGRDLADQLLKELKEKISHLNFMPGLGVILVGDDSASHLYVGLKEKAAAKVGIRVEKILLPATAKHKEIETIITTFNNRSDIHGILVQLPLPPHLPEQTIINLLKPTKDADGFHPLNLQKLNQAKPEIIPGVSQGIIKLIDLTNLPLPNKVAVILANSQEFAWPLVYLLNQRGVNTKILNSVDTKCLRGADIIIVALGQPEIITGAMVKDGAILIDVGTTKVNNKLKGDIKADDFADRQVYLTPVPGGIGPMTVALLLGNVYQLATVSGLN